MPYPDVTPRDDTDEMDGHLVGREDELLALDAALAAAGRGVGGVLVTGEAGIGKTSLTDVFLDRAADRGVLTLRCGGLPTTGSELPFAPVIQLLRHMRTHHRGTLTTLLGHRSRDVVCGLVPDLLPNSRTDGVEPATPGAARAQLLTVLADLFLDLATGSAVVVRVDDLQWVDTGTLSLLELLLRSGEEAPLLLVLVLREPVEARPLRQWCAAQGEPGTLTSLSVPPLDVGRTRELLERVRSSPVARGQAEEVHRRSGGNPFRVLELARVPAGVLPAAIRDVVQSEVERLPSSARDVVALVAVAGDRLEHSLLSDVLGAARAAAGASAAVHGAVLHEQDGSYTFGHDLARSSVLDSLLPAERMELHGRLGAALALRWSAAGASRFVEGEVAWHFHQAREWRQARVWNERAAASAEATGAYATAHHHLRQAVEAAVRSSASAADLLGLLERAAAAADREGAAADALAYVDQALALVDPADDGVRGSRLHGRRSWLYLVLGRTSEARRAAQASEDLLPASAPPAVRAEIALRCSILHDLTGERGQARQFAQAALDAARAAGDEGLSGRAMRLLAVVEPVHGGGDQAIHLLQRAWRHAVKTHDAEDVAEAAVSLGDRHLLLGRYEDAVRVREEARQLLSLVADGRHWLQELVDSNAVTALVALGRWDEAAAILREALPLESFGTARLARARLQLSRGALADAEADLAELGHLRRDDMPAIGLDYVEVLAELRLWQGRPGEALELVRSTTGTIDRTSLLDRGRGLCVLGLRALADIAVDARFRRSGAVATVAEGWGFAELALEVVTGDDVLTAVAAGELARMEGRPDPHAWGVAAASWGSRLPLRTAYAFWRRAEALLEHKRPRAETASALRQAAEICDGLGPTVLTVCIAELGRRGRIDVAVPQPRAAPTAGVPGMPPLSGRESEVLDLLVRGQTNKEIGEALYMSPKTVSVHVTHVLQKFGVRSRMEAAAAARHLGIAGGS